MKLFEWLKRLKINCRKWLFDLKWKGTFPKEFDVFFLEHFESDLDYLVFPGNVYAADTFVVNHLTVQGDFIADDYIECGDLTVTGSCITPNQIDCLIVHVGDLLDCYDIQSWEENIHASDYVCRLYEEEY